LYGEAFVDVNFNGRGEAQASQRLLNDAVSGVAFGSTGFGAGDAFVVGGQGDAGSWRAASCNCHQVMELEGLIDGGESVKTVRPDGSDGQAQVDFGVGAQGAGHQAASQKRAK
jgi:hypothetical protein